MNYNKTQVGGRLTRDPEVKRTNAGTAVAEISIAVNRKWRDPSGNVKEEVDFIDVTLWGKTAELAEKYLSKGRSVFIDGRLQLETWDDKTTGQKRTKLKVVGEAMQFINDGKGSAAPAQVASESAPADDDGEDIPF
jgi:single-strand DNA-binding protein